MTDTPIITETRTPVLTLRADRIARKWMIHWPPMTMTTKLLSNPPPTPKKTTTKNQNTHTHTQNPTKSVQYYIYNPRRSVHGVQKLTEPSAACVLRRQRVKKWYSENKARWWMPVDFHERFSYAMQETFWTDNKWLSLNCYYHTSLQTVLTLWVWADGQMSGTE